ncbi:MAG TPA: FAD-dependent oxidoreductase, partial [Myxococcota bacterium]|nr:FAD-dependent oxidoreductase [Myxococcota bacterium]
MRAVIVGNGVAGVEAALALRQRNPRASITLLSAEHPHFFSRTALMYVLAGQLSLQDTEPHGRNFFQKQGMELRTGRAIGLEPGRLKLEGGGELPWDRLLIASGSVGRPAPWRGAEGPGVHRFVTLQDLEGLERAVRPKGRVVVVGGGLIGVEVAEVLKLRGMTVDFVIREPWYFPVALDRREAKVVAEHISGHGVGVHLEEEVDFLERDPAGLLKAVCLKSGARLEAELVVAAIGVQPNTTWLRSSGL